MSGWMDYWWNEKIDEWISGQLNGLSSGVMSEWMDEQMDETDKSCNFFKNALCFIATAMWVTLKSCAISCDLVLMSHVTNIHVYHSHSDMPDHKINNVPLHQVVKMQSSLWVPSMMK